MKRILTIVALITKYPDMINLYPFLILFAVLILLAINGCVMLFTRNKVGIDGLIGKYVLVDRNYLDELNFSKKYE